MESRNRILKRVKQNQPQQCTGSIYNITPQHFSDVIEKFKETLIAIGGSVCELSSLEEVSPYVDNLFPNRKNELNFFTRSNQQTSNTCNTGHDYENIDLVVLKGQFGVAENGGIWITEKNMLDRALPFICENLILVVNRNDIVHTLHDAYLRIEPTEYQYGTFIAGPSKTADIEQSLVLGAHGAKSLTVLLIPNAI